MTNAHTIIHTLIKNEVWTLLKEELTKLDVPAIVTLIERSNELQSPDHQTRLTRSTHV
jgi:uncharacterized protein (UPF0276 family)